MQVETLCFGDLLVAGELERERSAPYGRCCLMAEVVTEVEPRSIGLRARDAIAALPFIRIRHAAWPDGIRGCCSSAHAVKRSLQIASAQTGVAHARCPRDTHREVVAERVRNLFSSPHGQTVARRADSS